MGEFERIGVVGLGNMGAPIVALLARAGYSVIVYDTDTGKSDALAQQIGIFAAPDLRTLASGSDLVITMLPNGAVVDRVAHELAPAMAGNLIVDMSSSAPSGTIRLGEALTEAGIGLLDAPVSGGVRRAVTGDLAIIIGGDREDVERVRPVLETLGKLFYTGRLGSAHALKALNNFVSAAGLAAACESLLIAERFGVDPDLAVEVLNSSSGRNNSTETKLRQFVLSGSFGAGFSAELMAKDIRTAADLARDLHIAAPMLEESVRLWTEAAGALEPGSDHTAIYRHLAALPADA